MEEVLTKKSFIKIFISSFCLGVIFFVAMFGIHIINPIHDDWIYQLYCDWKTADTAQHYFGWLYYRESPWKFPIGMISGMTTNDISIIYTDSMPIIAVVCKLFSSVLSSTFQYFGMASMLGFALNGAMGGILLRKGIKNDYICIALSIIFIMAPQLIETTFVATSLTGQWTILAALCLWFHAPYKNKWKNIVLWNVLIFVSMGLHLYTAAMVLGIFCVSVVIDMIEEKKYVFSAIKLLSGVVTSVLYLFLFGFFSGNYLKEDFNNDNAGDLLILLKPTDGEEYIGTILFGSHKMAECGYLGIGIIFGLIICGVMLLINRRHSFSISKAKIIACLVIMLGCYLFAVTTNVFFNGNLLCSLNPPYIISKIYGAFRINGRFIWVVMYLIDYFVLVGLYRSFNTKAFSLIVLFAIVAIQIFDCSGNVKAAKNRINNGLVYQDSVSEEMTEMIEDHELVYVKDIWPGYKEYWDIVNACYRGKTTLSSLYLARQNTEVKEQEDALYNDLQKGIVHKEVLYVFVQEELEGKNYPLTICDVGNYFYFGYVQ